MQTTGCFLYHLMEHGSQLYGTESLHTPGHPLTAAIVGATTEVMNNNCSPLEL